jgi:hypothetical protein
LFDFTNNDILLKYMETIIQTPGEPVKTGLKENILKPFTQPKSPSSLKPKILMVFVALLMILAGAGSGWLLSKVSSAKSNAPAKGVASNDKMVVSKDEAGIDDEEAFPYIGEGELKVGGIEGEGTHYLDRGLGEEKYVYLTSSVIDLQSFVGKKVKVWGQTMAGNKAGWLVDVGRIKVVE